MEWDPKNEGITRILMLILDTKLDDVSHRLEGSGIAFFVGLSS